MKGTVCAFMDNTFFFFNIQLRKEAGIVGPFDYQFRPPAAEHPMVGLRIVSVLSKKQWNFFLSGYRNQFDDVIQDRMDDTPEMNGGLPLFGCPLVGVELPDDIFDLFHGLGSHEEIVHLKLKIWQPYRAKIRIKYLMRVIVNERREV